MKILAMDTAAAACSVAYVENGVLKAHDFQEMARGHAAELLPIIEKLLTSVSMKIADFDALAVTIGPGAFTGLRIGLASARGFAAASNLPLIGVTTLEALSKAVSAEERQNRPVLCALDAKRSDLYMQMFDKDGAAMSEPVAQLPENALDLLPPDLTEVLVAGDCYQRLETILREKGITPVQASAQLPDAQYVAQVAQDKGIPADQMRPSALYIRPPDAAIPKNGGRLRP